MSGLRLRESPLLQQAPLPKSRVVECSGLLPRFPDVFARPFRTSSDSRGHLLGSQTGKWVQEHGVTTLSSQITGHNSPFNSLPNGWLPTTFRYCCLMVWRVVSQFETLPFGLTSVPGRQLLRQLFFKLNVVSCHGVSDRTIIGDKRLSVVDEGLNLVSFGLRQIAL